MFLTATTSKNFDTYLLMHFCLSLSGLEERSETSLQSDRINSERNWVKYILIEYCKKAGVSEWSGTISMILHQEY